MATQSTVASSGIDICSRSLILIGADPITSFSDGTTESNVAVNVYEDEVFSNLSATDVVIADYSFRADESNWPSYFTLAVEYALAIIFSTSIARDSSLATLMQAQAERSMAKARNLDSQQQTTSKLTTSRFITSRRS